MKKFLSLGVAALFAAACIYPYDPEVETAPEGVLVVDGDVSIGARSTVRLDLLRSLYPAPSSNGALSLSSANVWVEDDAGVRYPGSRDASNPSTSSVAPGLTYSVDTREAPADRQYRLCVNVLGATYTSDWSLPSAPPVIREIAFDADDENVTVNVSVAGGEGSTGYLLLSFDETWEFHVEYFPSYSVSYDEFFQTWSIGQSSPDFSKYWCWKYQDNGLTIPVEFTTMAAPEITAYPLTRFPRSDSRNHRSYEINVKARTLSPQSYRFIKNLEDNSLGGDNLFSPNPGDLPSNIRCETDPDRPVLGYVLTSRTVSRRAFLDNRYFKDRAPENSSVRYLLENEYLYYWGLGYLPLVENMDPNRDPEREGPFGWGPPRCYDCTAAGGTLERPGTPEN